MGVWGLEVANGNFTISETAISFIEISKISFTKFHKVSTRYELSLFEFLGVLTMTLGGYERGN